MTQPVRDIAITARPTANPQVCTFTVDRQLHDGRAVHCRRPEDAEGSPLLAALMALDDVREVLVLGATITIAKRGDRGWQALGPDIGTAIRESLAGESPPIASEWSERTADEEDIRTAVADLLEREVNPQIASHGGRIAVADVKGTSVYLEMSGGCQGCAAAQATLTQGVEQAIRRAAPAVTEIVDVTDHASGTDPYYR
jgi:Fe-S cluster biogenesis protein NfuA